MRKRQEDEAGRAQEGGVASAHGPTPFEEEENNEHQWDVGIGNLIIDLDADIASSDDTTVMPSSGGTGNYTSAIEPPHQQQQQQQGLLKMKIKRSRPSPGNKQSEAKHEIVKNSLEMNGSPNQNDANRRPSAPLKVTNGVPGVVIPATGVTVTPIMRIPTVKSSPLLTTNGSSMTVTPLFNTAAVKTGTPVTGQPTKEEDAAKKTKAEACVGTSDVLTMTEPDCLGPCEPGTQVSLDGIVWQETEGGVLVVNVTWRGKTYVGTLLDCTSHDWAPPRFCDSPSSDTESRVSRGRAAKRGRCGASNSSTPVPSESPFSPMHSKLRLTVKGRRGFPGAPSSPAKDSSVLKRKAGGRFPEEPISSLKRSSRSPIGELPSQPGSPTFIECPEPNCSKKYRHINGLRYHQSHAHGGVASPTANNDAEDLDEEPPPEETKLGDINEDSVPVGNIGKNEEVGVPVDSSISTASQDSRNHPEAKNEESQIPNGRDEQKETSAELRNAIPEELETAEEQREEVQSPAYSDISEPNDQIPEETNDEISEDLNKKVTEPFPTGTFVSPFYPQTPFMTPQSADDPKIIKDDPKLLPKPSPALGPFLHSYDFYPDPSRKNPEKEVTIIKETRLPPKRENPPSPKFRPITTVATATSSNERGKNEGIKPTMESHGPPSSVPFPYSLHPFSPMIPSPFFSSPQLNFLQTSPFYAVALPKAGDSNSPARPQAPQMKIEKSVIAGSKPLMSGGALQVTASTRQGPGPVGPLIPGPPFPSPSTYAPGKPILRP